MTLDVIGFGSLNLDEFWEVPSDFLKSLGFESGHEYIKDVDWFRDIYPQLMTVGSLKAIDPGGSAANMIAALRRMGFNTGFFGATGLDGISAMRIDNLGAMNNLAVEILDGPTGRCLCLINSEDEHRDRCLVILPNANDLAGARGFDPEYFSNSKWLHMTSFVSSSPRDIQKNIARNLASKIRLSFDPGAVYSRLGMDELEPILRRSDVVFTTEEELSTLTGCNNTEDSSRALLEMGVGILIIKLGERGLMATTESLTIFQDAVKPAAIVDRTGAGDVAAAGFIAGMLKGISLDKCLELAARTASRSIEGYGRATYPDRNFIEFFLNISNCS